MSNRWWLSRDDVQIQWGRNDEPVEILTVFVEAEMYADPRWVEAVRRSESAYENGVQGEALQEADSEYLETVDGKGAFGYRASARAVLGRLRLMGFTPEACRHEVSSAIADVDDLGDVLEVFDKHGRVSGSMPSSDILDRALQAFEAGQAARLTDPLAKACATYIDIFSESGMDPRVLLSLQLAAAPDDAVVDLDLHDLYLADYFEGVADITGLAGQELAVAVSSTSPVIVVTEGPTDARYLQRALELVAPEVHHLFRFLDMSTGVETNSAQVVRILRSFAAAGVTNRVVGVLDNDVAGRVSARQLDARPRPSTNRYFLLPDVGYARSYPTYGPNGLASLDVNGRAVSIEFQFGEDRLRDAQGDLVPVEWHGRDQSLKEYQGRLSKSDKDTVQRNIESFLDSASADHDRHSEPWTTIYTLIDRLLASATPEAFPSRSYPPPAPAVINDA